MLEDVDKSARRSVEMNTKPPLHVKVWRGLVRWWDDQPPVISIVFAIAAVAILILLTGWESIQSGRGWAMVTKDTAPAELAFLAGMAATMGYVVFHRRASERYREAKALRRQKKAQDRGDVTTGPRIDRDDIDDATNRGRKAFLTASILAALSLWGVFSNLASKTAITSEAATEVSAERTALIAEIAVTERDVSTFNAPLVEAMLLAYESQLAGMTAEAKGWGMANLDAVAPADAPADYPGPACLNDLKPRQRELCNAVNGTANQSGLRGEVAGLMADLERNEQKQKELAEKKEALSKIEVVEGAKHWEAMQELSSGNVSSDTFRIWGMFLASVFFLFAAGWGWDELFENVEKRKAKT